MSNIKTILQVLPSLNSGGVERGTLEMADFIVKKKYNSIVISGGGRLVESLENSGSRHIELNIGKKSPLALLNIPKIISIIKKYNIDLIHARSRLPAWIIYLALKFIPKKIRPFFVTTIHGYNSVSFYSSIMTKGDRVIVVSESLKKFVFKNYKIEKNKVFLIHRGVPKNLSVNKNDKEFKKWNSVWQASNRNIRGRAILTLPSRLSRRKGIELFLKLIQKLKEQNLKVVGLIVGDAKSKNYLEEIQVMIKKLNIQDHILLLGFRPDIYNIMSISHIVFSIQTVPESFGRIVVESIKIGTPVIGFNHGGAGEQLKHIFPEGIVKLNNEEELFRKTLLFLEKKPKVKKFNMFTLEEMKEKTLSVYKSFENNE